MTPMLPANRLQNVHRRVERACNISVTCPASRHLHIIADALARKKPCHMLIEDPEHCALTMLSVLESLWKARKKLNDLAANDARKRRLQRFVMPHGTIHQPPRCPVLIRCRCGRNVIEDEWIPAGEHGGKKGMCRYCWEASPNKRHNIALTNSTTGEK